MWNRFNVLFACTSATGVAGAFLFVLLVDPLGVSPVSIFPGLNVVYNNRRQAMPQIIRSNRFDSFIIGTSTTITIDPVRAEAAFGGKFANVAIYGATQYEQSRVIDLVGRQGPKMILLGLDATWCSTEAPTRYHPWWPFPEWLYGDVSSQDLRRLLNWHMVRLAVSKLRLVLGVDLPVVLANGFETQLPRDSDWTIEKARSRLYAGAQFASGGSPNGDRRLAPDVRSTEVSASFPALSLLEASIAQVPLSTKVVILFMPIHVAALPSPGTGQYNQLEACKQRGAGIGRRPNTHVIDFMRRSAITEDDSHFWDSVHMRDAVAAVVVERTREAVARHEPASDGTYGYLGGSPAGSGSAGR